MRTRRPSSPSGCRSSSKRETSLQEVQEALGDALGVAPNDPPDDFVRLVRVGGGGGSQPRPGKPRWLKRQELLAEMERAVERVERAAQRR